MKGTVLIHADKMARYIVTSANQKKPTVPYKKCGDYRAKGEKGEILEDIEKKRDWQKS